MIQSTCVLAGRDQPLVKRPPQRLNSLLASLSDLSVGQMAGFVGSNKDGENHIL